MRMVMILPTTTNSCPDLEEGFEIPLAVAAAIPVIDGSPTAGDGGEVTVVSRETVSSSSSLEEGEWTTATTTRRFVIKPILLKPMLLLTLCGIIFMAAYPNRDRITDDNNDSISSLNNNNQNNGDLSSSKSRATAPPTAAPTVKATTTDAAMSSSTATSPKQRDLFLLSGQSNMIGHTTSIQSIEGDGHYWHQIKSILDANAYIDDNIDNRNALAAMEKKLFKVIYETNFFNEQVATTLTDGVMTLFNSSSSLLKDLDTPLSLGKCSFKEASESSNGTITVHDVSQGTVPIKWDANCGGIFGHELLFSRTLELEMSYTNEFEMHKVARGGSEIFEHWYPNHGLHWNLLKEAIEERKGEGVDWKGFIWHQGSQEAWSEREYGEDRSLYYYGNLTGLVNEVRTLMFENSASYWQCKEEIPVVIVQVGYWPSDNELSQRVRDAQARLCDEDPRAVMVKSNDLSQNYHFDAPSFLISGNRIAHAYQEALGGVVECDPIRHCFEPLFGKLTMQFTQSWGSFKGFESEKEAWEPRYEGTVISFGRDKPSCVGHDAEEDD